MDENIQRLRVGIYTIIVMLILAILIFLNSEGWNSTYYITMEPDNAPGVKIGTPVRKNGILIGRVADVTNVGDRVRLLLAIRETEHVYANETVSIGAESVLGDAGLEFVPLTADKRGTMLVNNGAINPERILVRPNPMDAVVKFIDLQDDVSRTLESIEQTSDTIGAAATGIESLTSQVSGILNDEDSDLKKMVASILNLSAKADSALEEFQGIFETVNATITDPENQDNFKLLIGEIPALVGEIRVGANSFRQVIDSFTGVGDKVNGILDDTKKLTSVVGEQGPDIVANINDSVKDIRNLMAKADRLGKVLDNLEKTFGNTEGTVGKLFNDSEAYDEALLAIKNVREMTEDFKVLSIKLEPILNDVRVFTDKAARSGPSGVIRNALKKNPPDSGYKGTPGSGFFR